MTFVARRAGYALAMNRDEKRTRPIGLAPRQLQIDGRQVLCPSEPTGGTWIGVNDAGVTLALINWYSVKASVSGMSISRGDVVREALGSVDVASAVTSVRGRLLNPVNPFRLIGIFPKTKEIVEWQWDLKGLKSVLHEWKTETWISSGYDEPGAQLERRKVFEAALNQSSAGSLNWLRRLHRSHRPGKGPYSTCMHREDASTVSYTEVVVSAKSSEMRYFQGQPCCRARKEFGPSTTEDLLILEPLQPPDGQRRCG